MRDDPLTAALLGVAEALSARASAGPEAVADALLAVHARGGLPPGGQVVEAQLVALLRAHARAIDAALPAPATDDPVEAGAAALQRAALAHPLASRALAGALIKEGAAFAETDEGRAWSHRVAGSRLRARARQLWSVLGLDRLDPDGPEVLPGAMVDGLEALAASPAFQETLSRLAARGEEA